MQEAALESVNPNFESPIQNLLSRFLNVRVFSTKEPEENKRTEENEAVPALRIHKSFTNLRVHTYRTQRSASPAIEPEPNIYSLPDAIITRKGRPHRRQRTGITSSYHGKVFKTFLPHQKMSGRTGSPTQMTGPYSGEHTSAHSGGTSSSREIGSTSRPEVTVVLPSTTSTIPSGAGLNIGEDDMNPGVKITFTISPLGRATPSIRVLSASGQNVLSGPLHGTTSSQTHCPALSRATEQALAEKESCCTCQCRFCNALAAYHPELMRALAQRTAQPMELSEPRSPPVTKLAPKIHPGVCETIIPFEMHEPEDGELEAVLEIPAECQKSGQSLDRVPSPTVRSDQSLGQRSPVSQRSPNTSSQAVRHPEYNQSLQKTASPQFSIEAVMQPGSNQSLQKTASPQFSIEAVMQPGSNQSLQKTGSPQFSLQAVMQPGSNQSLQKTASPQFSLQAVMQPGSNQSLQKTASPQFNIEAVMQPGSNQSLQKTASPQSSLQAVMQPGSNQSLQKTASPQCSLQAVMQPGYNQSLQKTASPQSSLQAVMQPGSNQSLQKTGSPQFNIEAVMQPGSNQSLQKTGSPQFSLQAVMQPGSNQSLQKTASPQSSLQAVMQPGSNQSLQSEQSLERLVAPPDESPCSSEEIMHPTINYVPQEERKESYAKYLSPEAYPSTAFSQPKIPESGDITTSLERLLSPQAAQKMVSSIDKMASPYPPMTEEVVLKSQTYSDVQEAQSGTITSQSSDKFQSALTRSHGFPTAAQVPSTSEPQLSSSSEMLRLTIKKGICTPETCPLRNKRLRRKLEEKRSPPPQYEAQGTSKETQFVDSSMENVPHVTLPEYEVRKYPGEMTYSPKSTEALKVSSENEPVCTTPAYTVKKYPDEMTGPSRSTELMKACTENEPVCTTPAYTVKKYPGEMTGPSRSTEAMKASTENEPVCTTPEYKVKKYPQAVADEACRNCCSSVMDTQKPFEESSVPHFHMHVPCSRRCPRYTPSGQKAFPTQPSTTATAAVGSEKEMPAADSVHETDISTPYTFSTCSSRMMPEPTTHVTTGGTLQPTTFQRGSISFIIIPVITPQAPPCSCPSHIQGMTRPSPQPSHSQCVCSSPQPVSLEVKISKCGHTRNT